MCTISPRATIFTPRASRMRRRFWSRLPNSSTASSRLSSVRVMEVSAGISIFLRGIRGGNRDGNLDYEALVVRYGTNDGEPLDPADNLSAAINYLPSDVNHDLLGAWNN